MNSTQWFLLLVPAGMAYLYFVAAARTDGQVNYAANVMIGLIAIPLILAMVPFILLSAGLDLLRKREWGPASFVFIALLALAGYGALVLHLRDRPPPSPEDLPVENPAELQVEKQ